MLSTFLESTIEGTLHILAITMNNNNNNEYNYFVKQEHIQDE